MAEDREDGTDKTDDKDLLELARKRFKAGIDSEAEIRDDHLRDMVFFDGDQWDEDAKQRREQDSRPCITLNRIKQFVRNVTNEQRQQRPSIKINPVDDEADVETAKVLSGIIRHIEYDSLADQAYDTAGFHAVTMGRGYFRVITDYVDTDSFEQEIKIERIKDPLTVVLESDSPDASWGFVIETMTKEAFKEAYPDADVCQAGVGWSAMANGSEGWMTEDSIRVAEYFYREDTPDTLLMLADGSTVLKSEYDGDASKIRKRRSTVTSQWHWAKLTHAEVLEQTDWPGKYLPIIPVLGEEYIVDGKRRLRGIVNDAKESQQMLNFMISNELEMISLMPKTPWVAAEGQIEGYEKDWYQSNLRAVPVLQYKTTDVSGERMPPPQRQNIDPNIGALSTARMQASEDMKAVTGIYDASLGAKSNETSGRAILARQQQSATTNYHYIDNLTRAIRHLGRILVDLIPKVYDTPRVINITGENGEQELVTINRMFQRDDGSTAFHQLDAGKYDVVVSTGPSYATKRQEAVESFLALAQSAPQLMVVAPDIVVGNMDFPGAEEIAARFRKALPPNLAEDKKADAETQLAQASQAVQTQQQQLEALNAHAQAVEQELEQLQGKAQAEQLRFEVDMQKLQLDAARIQLEHDKFELDKQLSIAKSNLEREVAAADLALRQQKLEIDAEVAGQKLQLDAVKHVDDVEHRHAETALKAAGAVAVEAEEV